MGLSSWLYTSSTKQVVKIVHPGGHAELHDRPVLAADIIHRNPRCCVAHPNVFHQPWAIVAPETTLMPGQKFYVVPIATIRKLQKLSLKYCPAQFQETQNSHDDCNVKGEERDNNNSISTSTCWLFKNMNTTTPDNGLSSNDSYCACLLRANKIKINGEDLSKETRISSNFKYSEAKGFSRKRRSYDIKLKAGSPKRLISHDHWQPGLESISEE